MIVSGCALAMAPSSVPTSPSLASARMVSEMSLVPVLSFGATSSSIDCITVGMPAMVMTLPIQKPGAPDTLLTTSAAPCGMRAMRMRASLSSPPVLASRSFRIATASGWNGSATPKAVAMQSAVMSSCVGPMPPVVIT